MTKNLVDDKKQLIIFNYLFEAFAVRIKGHIWGRSLPTSVKA